VNLHPLAAAILEQRGARAATSLVGGGETRLGQGSAPTVAIVGDRQLAVAALAALLLRDSDFHVLTEARGTSQVQDALDVHQPAIVVEARNDADHAPIDIGRMTIPSTEMVLGDRESFASAVVEAIDEASHRPTTHPDARLTERERAILSRIASGQSVKQVARDCAIAPKTVGNHINKICRKLNLRGRGQLVMFAFQQGLTSA
jgi:DNA-binding CsgD family transcriptional regulator